MLPVMVNSIRFDSVAAAARYVGKQIQGEISPRQICDAIEGGCPIGGMRISKSRPKSANRNPLVRYPAGTSALERGIPEAWR